jgi:hypothetical protein
MVVAASPSPAAVLAWIIDLVRGYLGNRAEIDDNEQQDIGAAKQVNANMLGEMAAEKTISSKAGKPAF